MFVRSEDGDKIVPITAWGLIVSRTGVPWEIACWDYSMAEYPTEEQALARMDDVCDWLDAPSIRTRLIEAEPKEVSRVEAGNVTSIIKRDMSRQEVTWLKPVVYEFSAPIGAWKEGVK